jgi:rare lipoprotein A (peptidoglycan hydrolase)
MRAVMSKTKMTNEETKKQSTKKQDTADATQVEAASEVNSEAKTKDSTTSAVENATTPTEEGASQLDGVALPATSGKAGVLGGSKDRGVKPEDKLALPAGRHFTYERVHSLNPKTFYCAMRWDYRIQGKSPEEGKRWWANKKILVTNPANGNQVVVRAVDYGPHENTGLTISLSPAALEVLALEVGGEVKIEFADQKVTLGVVNP